MTWQRIDEDTYIDDTLVTCAEYQLFIDELRRQGKNFKPDHWAQDRFPVGYARSPILGMRPSDAQQFCTWLSQHDYDNWHYRLPTTIEAEEFTIKSKFSDLSLGYWTIRSGNEAYDFVWINVVPAQNDILKLSADDDRNLQKGIDLHIDLAFTLLKETGTEANRLPLMLKINNLRTLRERIAGRSPAFEGIRLVKERIK